MVDTAEQIIEHIGGDFGATVIYEVGEVHVDFVIAEIIARDGASNAALYERKGSGSSMDHVTDPNEAEPMVNGSVKWDGCSHVYFGDGDNQGYLHLCGREHFDKLASVLATVYERCGELMQANGVNLLDGEFACDKKSQPR